jgi:hypothetical protein
VKLQILAAMLGIGGLFVSGCSSSNGTAVGSPHGVMPGGIIRSQSDLQRYLTATATTGSPLSALSSGARERFLSSITFGAKGISGFRFADLQSDLTVSQIYDVLGLFGVQKDVAIIPNVRVETAADNRVMSSLTVTPTEGGGGDGDYMNYRCSARATCSISNSDICTSNC